MVTITITVQEETLCPVARVFLPGNLALIEGGANAQTAYRPIKQTGGRGQFSRTATTGRKILRGGRAGCQAIALTAR